MSPPPSSHLNHFKIVCTAIPFCALLRLCQHSILPTQSTAQPDYSVIGDNGTGFSDGFLMEMATCSAPVARMTTNADTPLMMQAGRNLTEVTDGFLLGKPYLIVDRGTKVSV